MKTRELCNRHYIRLLRHGDPRAGAAFRASETPDECTVEGCNRPHGSKGFCRMHYGRWRRHGDPTVLVMCLGRPVKAFMRRIRVIEGGCWDWQGGKTTAGYGIMTVGNETTYAHHFVFESYHGRPIRDGFHLHHICRLPTCVNPLHLQEITPTDHARLHLKERWARA